MTSTLMTKRQTAELLQYINSFYPHVEVTQARINAWHDVMHDQEYESVMRKVKKYCTENKFPPTVADLYERKRPERNKDFIKQVDEWEKEAIGKPPGS